MKVVEKQTKNCLVLILAFGVKMQYNSHNVHQYTALVLVEKWRLKNPGEKQKTR